MSIFCVFSYKNSEVVVEVQSTIEKTIERINQSVVGVTYPHDDIKLYFYCDEGWVYEPLTLEEIQRINELNLNETAFMALYSKYKNFKLAVEIYEGGFQTIDNMRSYVEDYFSVKYPDILRDYAFYTLLNNADLTDVFEDITEEENVVTASDGSIFIFFIQ